MKRADLYQEGSRLWARGRLNHSSQGGDAPALDQPQEATRKVLPSTLPVLQDGLLPRFNLPLPLLVVGQGVMRQGRSSITSAAKKTGVPPAERGFGEYTVGSRWEAHQSPERGWMTVTTTITCMTVQGC